MGEITSKYRLHSARRGGPRSSPVLVIAVLAVIAVIALVALVSSRNEPTTTTAAPSPSPTPSPLPTAPPSPTPTSGPVKEASGWLDAEVVLPPSPTPTYPPLEVVPTRAPQPTPSISQCAAYRFSTVQVFTPSAQVKVEIRVDNRCPYDLGPSNLVFEITGWRDGGRIQSVRGVPFETIRRGRWGDLSIGLPGSLDWYDEIEVVVFD
jgi:hypothetical protein